jgi:hypothetical protein
MLYHYISLEVLLEEVILILRVRVIMRYAYHILFLFRPTCTTSLTPVDTNSLLHVNLKVFMSDNAFLSKFHG